jgi:hypothetical protein
MFPRLALLTLTLRQGPSRWLLGPEPVAAMHDEYSRLALLANHFSVINNNIYIFLEEDHHAEKVRATFWPFNKHMGLATTEFHEGLWRAY